MDEFTCFKLSDLYSAETNVLLLFTINILIHTSPAPSSRLDQSMSDVEDDGIVDLTTGDDDVVDDGIPIDLTADDTGDNIIIDLAAGDDDVTTEGISELPEVDDSGVLVDGLLKELMDIHEQVTSVTCGHCSHVLVEELKKTLKDIYENIKSVTCGHCGHAYIE